MDLQVTAQVSLGSTIAARPVMEHESTESSQNRQQRSHQSRDARDNDYRSSQARACTSARSLHDRRGLSTSTVRRPYSSCANAPAHAAVLTGRTDMVAGVRRESKTGGLEWRRRVPMTICSGHRLLSASRDLHLQKLRCRLHDHVRLVNRECICRAEDAYS